MSAPVQGSSLEKAREAYRAGDYESAIALLADTDIDESDYREEAYLLGLCFVRVKRFDEALLYLEQIVTSGEDDERAAQCRLALAYVYSMTGRSKLAEYELTRLLDARDAASDAPQVYAALGHTSWMQGRLDEGLKWYGKALARDPENLNALNGYGYLLACEGKELTKAVTFCRKALDGAPGNPAYTDSLGWAYFKLGSMDEARRYLYEAAESLGEHPESKAHIEAFERGAGL